MTLNLRLSSETEVRLREQAATSGLDLEAFVLQAVIEKLGDAEPIALTRNGTDWAERLRECIDLHPVVTHYVDDSRESIYAGRGE